MSAYWFRPKRYGYGATPVTWEGWALTFAGAAVIAVIMITVLTYTALAWVFWLGFPVVFAFIEVSRRKTDGEWRWRWGDR
jgi:hypothetical protein